MTRSELKRWLAAVGYVGFIYATLSAVVAPLRFLRTHNLLRITLGLVYGLTFFSILRALTRRGRRTLWRVLLLFVVFIGYGFITRFVTTPEEQFHFVEYGLVGCLFAWALRSRIQNPAIALPVALILAGLAGWIDELIQGHVPNRHYDVHDIALNVVSAFMGLVIYALFLEVKTDQEGVFNRARSSSTQS